MWSLLNGIKPSNLKLHPQLNSFSAATCSTSNNNMLHVITDVKALGKKVKGSHRLPCE